jgi:uncharacterized protein YeeX (DUF496 family)
MSRKHPIISLPLSLHQNILLADLASSIIRNHRQQKAKVNKQIEDHMTSIHDNPKQIDFLLSIIDNQSKDLITYNQILEFICVI